MKEELQQKDSFVFYKSYYEAIKDVDDKHKLELFNAICELSFCGEKSKLSGISTTLFKLIEPQILANYRKFVDGKLGGRPSLKKPMVISEEKPMVISEEKPMGKPEIKPNVNGNVNVNVNGNVNGNSITTSEDDLKDNPPSEVSNKKYAFCGYVIKMQDDLYKQWTELFCNLDLKSELYARDLWLKEQPVEQQKKWMMSTSSLFAKKNTENKKEEPARREKKEAPPVQNPFDEPYNDPYPVLLTRL